MIEMSAVDLLATKLGAPNHAEGSSEFIFRCPFCAEEHGSEDTKGHLYVNPDKAKWICFRCSSRGTLERLFERIGLDPLTEPDPIFSVDELAKALEAFQVTKEQEVPRLVLPCEDPRPVVPGTDAFRWLHYVRGYEYEQIDPYHLQWGRHRFTRADGTVSPEENRIYFPVYDLTGSKMVYWVGRKYLSSSEKSPKYVNPPVAKTSVFNLHRAYKADWVILCEGVLSAMAAGPQGVALLGKTPTPAQIRLLVSLGLQEYVVSLDGDARKEAYTLCQTLLGHGCHVSMVDLPDGSDPDSLPRESYQQLLADRHVVSMAEATFQEIL